jgi:hypothetical protein
VVVDDAQVQEHFQGLVKECLDGSTIETPIIGLSSTCMGARIKVVTL